MKNVDLILRTMAETALESRKFPKKATGNNAVLGQLMSTIEAAAMTQHAQRHNKEAINEIFDRSTLTPKKAEKASQAIQKVSTAVAASKLASVGVAKRKATRKAS